MTAEVAERLGRPWEQVRSQLEDLFGREWEECEIFISTSADKKGRSEADVIVDLIREKADRKPSSQTKLRRGVIRWIGKPWRERPDPWDRFRDRVPPAGRVPAPDDLEEWTPLRPEER